MQIGNNRIEMGETEVLDGDGKMTDMKKKRLVDILTVHVVRVLGNGRRKNDVEYA